MDKIAKLFRFQGRAGRLTYWKTQLLVMVGMAVVWCGGLLLAVAFHVGALSAVALAGPVIAVPIGLAVYARRLHDRNKSAWWLLIFWAVPVVAQLAVLPLRGSTNVVIIIVTLVVVFVGIIASIWGVVEIGFLKGTRGPNRFGADPIAPQEPIVTPSPAVS